MISPWAAQVIPSYVAIGSTDPTKVGAKRILNGVRHKTLIRMEPENHLLEYAIGDGTGPVSTSEVSKYVGTQQSRLAIRPLWNGIPAGTPNRSVRQSSATVFMWRYCKP